MGGGRWWWMEGGKGAGWGKEGKGKRVRLEGDYSGNMC